MGASFNSGPSESAPKCFVKKDWTGSYELKYTHCAVRNAIDNFSKDIPLVNILLKLSELLLIRYKTKIEYTPGVGNNISQCVREDFFKTFYTNEEFFTKI